jgi:hypothetical protein
MTLDEMEAAGQRATAIKGALHRLAAAQQNLDLLHKFAAVKKSGRPVDGPVAWSWKPTLILQAGESYVREISVKIDMPYGVVEQQLVNAVSAARREVIKLGGSVP